MRESPVEIYWKGKKTSKMHLFSCNSQKFMTISLEQLILLIIFKSIKSIR